MKFRKTRLMLAAAGMAMALPFSSLPVFASESEAEIFMDETQTENNAAAVMSDEEMNADGSLYMEQIQEAQDQADELSNNGLERNQADAITVVANGQRIQTGSIEDALKRVSGSGTITINKSISGQARIRSGQEVTININKDVIWDNNSSTVTQGSWQNSVIVNEGGKLAVHSQGTVTADASKPQSFAIYNMPGAQTELYGGLYTSRHGDYIILNEGTMALNHKVLVTKPVHGSQSAVLNGFRWDNPGNNPAAKMSIDKAAIYAPHGIALKNDTYGEATIHSGFLSAKTCPIQNVHSLQVHGGDFYTTAPNGYGIYNSPSTGKTPGGEYFAIGHASITGGNFYCKNIFQRDATILALRGTAPHSNAGREDHSCIDISGGTFWAKQNEIEDNLAEGHQLINHIAHRWKVVKTASDSVTPDQPGEELPDQDQTPEEDGSQTPSNPSQPSVPPKPSSPSGPSSPGSSGTGSGSSSSKPGKPSVPGGVEDEIEDLDSISLFRRYNPHSGEHFYTADLNEAQMLLDMGWKDEGTGWIAPSKSSAPVFRLYNPNAGDHHFTTSKEEADHLVSLGWKDEGIGWYSADEKDGLPLYHQYNPNAKTGTHNYTLDADEKDHLVSLGWKDEGIAWYGVKEN